MLTPIRLIFIAAFTILLASVSPSFGTDRYFPDSAATSPNGRYRIDAKSPDNAAGRPFAANFTYTLTDTTTNRVVWTRKQPMKRVKGSERALPAESAPVELYVRNDGLVAAWTELDTVIFFRAADGRKIAESPVLAAFPESEIDLFVLHTTAGPMWTQFSACFFVDVPSGTGCGTTTPYFVVRPYWNKRLVINAHTGAHVELGGYRGVVREQELSGADAEFRCVLSEAIVEERRSALEEVSASPGSMGTEARWRLLAALHSISFLQLTQAEPDLRRWERWVSSSNDAQTLRVKLRETLRALGATPEPGFGVQIYPINSHYRSHVPTAERNTNAEKIVPGMRIDELTSLIGFPDDEVRGSPAIAFDYDIDAPSPYTLRIIFNSSTTEVKEVERIAPFAFLHDIPRMAGW